MRENKEDQEPIRWVQNATALATLATALCALYVTCITSSEYFETKRLARPLLAVSKSKVRWTDDSNAVVTLTLKNYGNRTANNMSVHMAIADPSFSKIYEPVSIDSIGEIVPDLAIPLKAAVPASKKDRTFLYMYIEYTSPFTNEDYELVIYRQLASDSYPSQKGVTRMDKKLKKMFDDLLEKNNFKKSRHKVE